MRKLQAMFFGLSMVVTCLIQMPQAEACGGFFCNNEEPTVQTGERILFTVDDGDIRAYVQVYYDGPADDFAWIVPVASVPDVGVGTDEVFSALDDETMPGFNVKQEIDSACYSQYYDEPYDEETGGGGYYSEGGGAYAEEEGSAEDSYVKVLAAGGAGPYNYEVVESNDSELLLAWLNQNDYEQPPESLPLIDHYVAEEMKFVAVKLQPGKDSGDIAPIILDFQEQSPCIPLILTSIAAEENMPVKAYVLGDQRAVPTNWFNVTLNQKKLDWIVLDNGGQWSFDEANTQSSYQNVLMEAIAEAEGHAFTTEYAGPSDIMKNRLDNGQYDGVEELLTYTDPVDFVMALQNYFSGSNQLLTILQKYIPVPESAWSANDFYNWPEDYQAEYDKLDIDLQALYDELIAVIVKPVQEAQEMFDEFPYLTRLYSRVSVAAMDRDPVFDFQDAGDISNEHTATFHMKCEEGQVSYYMELENGETFIPTTLPDYWEIDPEENTFEGSEGSTGGGEGAGDATETDPEDESEEAEEEGSAALIELFSPGKERRVVAPEDVAYVDEQLQVQLSEDVEVPGDDGEPSGEGLNESSISSSAQDAEPPASQLQTSTAENASSSSSGGCAMGNTHVGIAWMTLMFLGLWIARRKSI